MSVIENVKRVIFTKRTATSYQNSVIDLAFAYHNPIVDAALKLEITSFFRIATDISHNRRDLTREFNESTAAYGPRKT